MPLLSTPPVPSSSLILSSATPLTKDQKAFNTLVKKIEAQRKQLAEWNEAIPQIQQKYVSDLLPLQDKETDLCVQLARRLDQAWSKKGITKAEQRKLSGLIVDLAQEILEGRDDDEIKNLYNLHSQSDFDAEESARQGELKAMLEDMIGMDLGEDVDMNSLDDVMQRVESQFHALQEENAAQYYEDPAPRKKSAKAKAREAKKEAEEKEISQSIREVYRKLASALHPDREPDATERVRKTELMQRVNDAYEKRNLLQLLELQLQLEHIDPDHLANLSAERLKHYIKILKDQLAELDSELQRHTDHFAMRFGLSPFEKLRPSGLIHMLHQDIATCTRNVRQLQQEVAMAADLKELKAWLKQVKHHHRPESDDDFPF
jgi:ABC-type Zn uptake system ZnuABC Zn-binding protein ZnuA